jgi:hypothetical protein
MSRVKKGMFSVRLVLVGALAASLSAQIQFPGSGGPFPGGGGPIGGGGRRGKNTDSAPSKGKKTDAPVVTTTTGMLRAVAGNQFVIEGDDHRIITYKAGDKMTVMRDGKPVELTSFAIADHISVDSTADDMGFFTATGVTFNMPGTAHERNLASRTWDLPNLGSASAKPVAAKRGDDDDDRPTLRRSKDDDAGAPQQKAAAAAAPTPVEPEPEALPTTLIRPSDPPPDSDDPGRPQVRRGKPAPRVSASNTEPEPVSTPSRAASTARAAEPPSAPVQAYIPVEEDPIVVKARAAAAEYAGSLPNFFCRQLTTRYDSDRPKDGWQAHDTIAADLAYENGHENYTNIKVGSKTVKSMEEVGGNWSTGEFASMLDEVFDPDSATTFRKTGQDTINGRSATTFKFEITRERSGWRISDGGQLYYPAMRGTIWIDKETSRVLRLEKETRNMPLLFPLVKVEVAVDYDFVRLSTPQPFLLPITSEVLSCEQGSTRCVRNRIEFRNYRKFGAESGITFDEKQ